MASDGEKRLFIGDVTALTGISAGRVRHYEDAGLIELEHTDSGYRTFGVDQLSVLLQIDILRGLGVGLAEIRKFLSDPEHLPELLAQHRAALELKRSELEATIATLDRATDVANEAAARGAAESVGNHQRPRHQVLLANLATPSLAEPFDVVGHLDNDLSPEAAELWGQLFKTAPTGVRPLFGRLIIPIEVTDCLEDLARARGHQELVHRLYVLVQDLRSLPQSDLGRARELAERWIDQQDRFPLDTAVIDILDSQWPELGRLPFCRVGLYVWASSQSQAAGAFLLAAEDAARRRGGRCLCGLFIPGR